MNADFVGTTVGFTLNLDAIPNVGRFVVAMISNFLVFFTNLFAIVGFVAANVENGVIAEYLN